MWCKRLQRMQSRHGRQQELWIVIRFVAELWGGAHYSLTQAKAARIQGFRAKAATKTGQPPQTTRFQPDHGVRGRGVWPQVWPQKQVLRNRAALSALQKVATKHLQSPHAPHHTHITVSNHRTAGQPRAPFVVTSEEQRKSKKSSADMYCFPEEVDFRAE